MLYTWMAFVLGIVILTKVLHVLVGRQLERASLTLSTLRPGAVSLEHDYAIGDCCGQKRGTVGEPGPAAVKVEGEVAQGVTESAQEECDMAAEPCELESLYSVSMIGTVSACEGCSLPARA